MAGIEGSGLGGLGGGLLDGAGSGSYRNAGGGANGSITESGTDGGADGKTGGTADRHDYILSIIGMNGRLRDSYLPKLITASFHGWLVSCGMFGWVWWAELRCSLPCIMIPRALNSRRVPSNGTLDFQDSMTFYDSLLRREPELRTGYQRKQGQAIFTMNTANTSFIVDDGMDHRNMHG